MNQHFPLHGKFPNRPQRKNPPAKYILFILPISFSSLTEITKVAVTDSLISLNIEKRMRYWNKRKLFILGLATVIPQPKDLEAYVRAQMYNPDYEPALPSIYPIPKL